MPDTFPLLVISTALQLAAVVAALGMIRLTRTKTAWLLLSATFALMLLRRLLSLAEIVVPQLRTAMQGVPSEVVALAISILLCLSLWKVRGMFLTWNRAEEEQRRSHEQFRTVVENMPVMFHALDAQGRFVFWNREYERCTGYPAAQVVGHLTPFEILCPDPQVRQRVTREWKAQGREYRDWEWELTRADGTRRMIAWSSNSSRLPFPGWASWGVGVDVTAHRRAEAMLELQRNLLERTATRAPLAATLEALVREAEALAPGMAASVLTLDEDGVHLRHAAAPNLPDEYNRQVDGLTIGPQAGSCGTACHRRQRVIVTDIEQDPLWAPFRDLGRAFGLRACWSEPILASSGAVLGTFAMYYRVPRGPDADELALIETCARLAALSIERERTEAALLESGRRLAGIIDAAMDGIISMDEDQRVVLMNPAAEQVFGYRADEVIGQTVEMLMPPRSRSRHAGLVRDFARSGVTTRRMGGTESIWGMRRNGEEFPLEASISQITAGGRRLFTVILRDITERHQADLALRESRALLERAMEVGRIGSWWSDPSHTGRLKWSRETCRICGIREEDFDGRVETFFNLVAPEDRPAVARASQAAIEGGARYSIDHRLIRPDGKLIWLHEEADVVRDERGQPLQLIGICQDITDRKRTEEALRESQRAMATLVASLPGAVYRCRHDVLRSMEFVSEGAEALTGHPAEALRSNRVTFGGDLMHPEDSAQVREEIRHAVDERRPYTLTYRIVTADRAERWVRERGQGVFDERGALQALEGFITDVTDLRRAEQELRSSEERLRLALAAGRMGTWDWDMREGRIVCSPDHLRLFGIEAADFDGRPETLAARIHAEDRPAAQAAREAAMKQRRRYEHEYRVVWPNGSLHWVRATGQFTFNDAGRGVRSVGVVQDITQQRKSQEALAESEARLRTILQTEPECVKLVSEDGRLLDMNPAGLAMIEADSLEQVIGQPVAQLLAPPYREAFRAMNALVFKGESCMMEFDLAGLKGTMRRMETHAVPMRDPEGRIVAQLAVTRDITARKHAEMALRESEARLRTAFENIPFDFWVCDRDGRYVFQNEMSIRHWGHVVGRRTEAIDADPAVTARWRESNARAFAGEVVTSEMELTRAGRPMFFHTVVAPIRDGDDVRGILGIHIDITERVLAQRALREARDLLEQRVKERTAQLESANRELEAFTYSVSHDLRAPVRHVGSFAKILLEQHGLALSGDARHCAEVIAGASVKLGRLIDDLLHFSRLGRQAVHRAEVDFAQVIRDIWSELAAHRPIGHVRLDVGALPPAHADPSLMRHVWMNLMDNAIKYSSVKTQPEIRIQSFTSDGEVWYSIEDNGVGFDPRYVDKLFGVFQRLHREEEFPGTGVGLALVQRIIQRHGGRIRAFGEPGRGARFEFTLGRIDHDQAG